MVKCSGVPEFHTILTLLYNFAHYSQENLENVPGVILKASRIYPEMKIIAAVPKTFNQTWNIPPQVETVRSLR